MASASASMSEVVVEGTGALMQGSEVCTQKLGVRPGECLAPAFVEMGAYKYDGLHIKPIVPLYRLCS